MLAWNAGALRALAMPVSSTAPYSVHSGLCVATSAASPMVTTICTTCMAMRKRIRLKRSASTPADEREQQQRPELHEDQQPDEGGRFGAVVDVGGKREVLHPRAHERQRHADEDDAEVAVRERRPDRAGRVAA